MQKEEKTLGSTCNYYNVRNMFVLKERESEFTAFRASNSLLKDCSVRQLIPSGNYLIYTFNITSPEQRAEIEKVESDWL